MKRAFKQGIWKAKERKEVTENGGQDSRNKKRTSK
jgi:hypothetical protein